MKVEIDCCETVMKDMGFVDFEDLLQATTEDVKEPVIPAEFTVLIHNKGLGDAQNVRMITHQPQIVENEKGLLVEFAIIASPIRQRGIYSIAGVKVSSSSTEDAVRQLPHGLYIINGKKVLMK